jgi:ribosomal protein S18 acetylase RimI-like enzyme
LLKKAVELARAAGAKTLDLTSRPSREAANRLYRRCGFEIRETNVYRMDLKALERRERDATYAFVTTT